MLCRAVGTFFGVAEVGSKVAINGNEEPLQGQALLRRAHVRRVMGNR